MIAERLGRNSVASSQGHGGGDAPRSATKVSEGPSMGTLTPELRAEIAQNLRASSVIQHGMTLEDMEQGMAVRIRRLIREPRHS
jgi:hypothetical protein